MILSLQAWHTRSHRLQYTLPYTLPNASDTDQCYHAQGLIPSEWSAGMPAAEYIVLTDCQLTGPVPASWTEMSSLIGLHLHLNLLSGSLPPFKYAAIGLHGKQPACLAHA